MGHPYPELIRAQALISETLKLEERRFRKTLERGLALLEEATSGLGSGGQLSGEVAFTLYDTYGFPLDLTEDALRARGIAVDSDGFQAAMERQRERARASWSGSGEAATEASWYALRDRIGPTRVFGLRDRKERGRYHRPGEDGREVDCLRAGDSGGVICNQTPFYAEAGGQVGDTGVIRGEGICFEVNNTEKRAGQLFVIWPTGTRHATPGQALTLEVDHELVG